MMTNNDAPFGQQDTTRRDEKGTHRGLRAGPEPQSPAVQSGHAPGGHAGHGWMMMICCVPMLVIAIALVASGAAGIGTIGLAIGCTVMMALMMRGMGGHSHDGGDGT